jgi:transposase-like protein
VDGYAASHRAVAQLKEVGTLPRRVRIRSSQYLNNVVEQDHRRIKQRIRPMLGFKRFETAAVTIRGIELAEKIKKNQFNLRGCLKSPNSVIFRRLMFSHSGFEIAGANPA